MNVNLVSPCTYQGGKGRLAKQIVDYVLSYVDDDISNYHFYDLCCGSGAVSIELMNRGIKPEQIYMCDKGSFGKFWEMIGNSSFDISEFQKYIDDAPKDKKLIQEHLVNLSKTSATSDEAYKYLLLQSGAFGGKQIWREGDEWKNTSFRSYWIPTETSNRRSIVNPTHPTLPTLYERTAIITKYCKGLHGYNTDIRSMLPIITNDGSPKIIYLDPPYRKTTGYGFTFDLDDFLPELLDSTVFPVLVSEYEAVSDNYVELTVDNTAKGGILGNAKREIHEYLSFFNVSEVNKIRSKSNRKKLF